MGDITLKLHDYEIVLSENLDALASYLSTSEYSSYFVLTDQNTHRHCLPLLRKSAPGLNFCEIVVRAGEEHKNLQTCEVIWDGLLKDYADRNALVINLGGGVVGDMGGFAASCYKRGVAFIQVPTTVLSQVDASVGGKLGVDFRYGKNLIGLFCNPDYIHVSNVFHASLPDREYINGFAEIFKHALIASTEQWEYYKSVKDLRSAGTIENLYRSLLVKKEIVEQDPREKGLRKALNFGHTLGHAVEANSIEKGDRPLLHGEAMAIGMILETYLSCQKLHLSEGVLEDVCVVMNRHFPYYSLTDTSVDSLWDYMAMDKKNVGRQVMGALIEAVGKPVLEVPIHFDDVKKALEYYNKIDR